MRFNCKKGPRIAVQNYEQKKVITSYEQLYNYESYVKRMLRIVDD